VFTSKPTNVAPYNAIIPKQNRLALNTVHSPDAARSARLDFSIPDLIPQHVLDAILWHTVHGPHSQPPPAGPNASNEEAEEGEEGEAFDP
jgi:hypothetical protein